MDCGSSFTLVTWNMSVMSRGVLGPFTRRGSLVAEVTLLTPLVQALDERLLAVKHQLMFSENLSGRRDVHHVRTCVKIRCDHIAGSIR